jgi:hypothetical protein
VRLDQEVIVTALKTTTRPWLLLSVALIALGLFAFEGAAGSIVLAFGLVVAFGVCIRFISRNDEPREEPRVPAGHSGV